LNHEKCNVCGTVLSSRYVCVYVVGAIVLFDILLAVLDFVI